MVQNDAAGEGSRMRVVGVVFEQVLLSNLEIWIVCEDCQTLVYTDSFLHIS